MKKIIVLSFLMLGVAFYELSGGADFVPESREAADIQVARAQTIETVAPTLLQPAKAAQVVSAPAPSNVHQASFSSGEVPAELPKIDLSKFAAPAQKVAKPAGTPNASDFIGDDIRRVTGSVVNMRAGPGTDYEVVAQLIQGDEAEVLIDDGTGWVQLRLQGGQTGWMADFLLTK